MRNGDTLLGDNPQNEVKCRCPGEISMRNGDTLRVAGEISMRNGDTLLGDNLRHRNENLLVSKHIFKAISTE